MLSTFQAWYLAWHSSRHSWTDMEKTKYQWELCFQYMTPMEESNEILGGKKRVLQQSTLPALGFNNDTYYYRRQRRIFCITQCSLSAIKYSILFLPMLDCSAIVTLTNCKYSRVGRNNLTREDALGDHTVITVLY